MPRAAKRAPPAVADAARARPGVHNADVAAAFEEIADLLELTEANPFRVRAYRNAARIVRDLGREVREMVDAGESCRRLPGIGKDLAEKIREIAPPATRHAARAPGADAAGARRAARAPGARAQAREGAPRRARRRVARASSAPRRAAGASASSPGFGEKTEERILRALEAREGQAGRFELADVTAMRRGAGRLPARGARRRRAEVAGSYRRCRETVGRPRRGGRGGA